MDKYDLEIFMREIESLVKLNLNNAIAAMNAEKNDSIVLKTIDDDAYFFQSLNGKEINYDPYLYYGLMTIETKGTNAPYGKTAESPSITVAIVFSDEGNEVDISWRALRYLRILKELFENNFDQNKNGVKLSVYSQVPVELQLLDDSRTDRAVGVILKADLV